MAKTRYPLSLLRSPAGFTLIELLVSGVIVSGMVFLAFFSMRLFLNEWEHRRLGDIRELAAYRGETLVRHALEGIWEYYVTDPLAERDGAFYPYFKGGSQGFAFVTASPIFHGGDTAAAEYLLLPGEEGAAGGGRLVYREAALTSDYLRYHDHAPAYDRLLEAATGIRTVRIRYFGLLEAKWDDQNETIREIRQWTDDFDGRERHAMPELIEIVTTAEQGEETVRTIRIKAGNTHKGGLLYRE